MEPKQVRCVWEHHGDDTLLYAADYPGAFTRGVNLTAAAAKMPAEMRSYLAWRGQDASVYMAVQVVQEKASQLDIRDADSDVLFDVERTLLTLEEYRALKVLVLRSAADFDALYRAVPVRYASLLPERRTFYGLVPRTADEMYAHTKGVNDYYFGEIGVDADHDGDILSCRRRGFDALEVQPDFLCNKVYDGSYGEQWTLRKVLRRFLWHDRIHAKALWRMAVKQFGHEKIADPFCFYLAEPNTVRRTTP